MRLDKYTVGEYSPGATLWQQVAWYYLGSPLVTSYWIVGSGFKCWVLRCFGAQVGAGVRIKPGLKVKFPWRLVVGDFVWLGENCWIDNVAMVTIDSHVCISQAVYLCTGNHDWSSPTFDLKDTPIHVGEGCWIAARASVGPGVTLGRGAVLCLGSVAGRSLEPMTIYAGNPAQPIKQRQLRLSHDDVSMAIAEVDSIESD
jgi:putative colanic acid biosynthesis acetyltransferase WcaF